MRGGGEAIAANYRTDTRATTITPVAGSWLVARVELGPDDGSHWAVSGRGSLRRARWSGPVARLW